ncbi:MAG: amidohydrolase family protein [Limisphaerales bacterium]
MSKVTRREFFGTASALALAGCKTTPQERTDGNGADEPIIDIHQHTHYVGRSDADLVRHQKTMGVTTTVLLPAGRHYGLDADCGGNESVEALTKKHPKSFVFFANELPYLKEADAVIRAHLNKGAIGIGEQKFRVLADSGYLDRMAEIAKDFGVPILLHFWDADYNMEMERFHTVLEKFPSVNFIGHAQSWWGHIDKNHDPKVIYPKGRVTAGGLTDRWLADYPNIFGDLSAGSGLNALRRDPDFTAGFLDRHQEKLMFGSDCPDKEGRGAGCIGAQLLATVRQYAGSKERERKILYGNAKRLLNL